MKSAILSVLPCWALREPIMEDSTPWTTLVKNSGGKASAEAPPRPLWPPLPRLAEKPSGALWGAEGGGGEGEAAGCGGGGAICSGGFGGPPPICVAWEKKEDDGCLERAARILEGLKAQLLSVQKRGKAERRKES